MPTTSILLIPISPIIPDSVDAVEDLDFGFLFDLFPFGTTVIDKSNKLT